MEYREYTLIYIGLSYCNYESFANNKCDCINKKDWVKPKREEQLTGRGWLERRWESETQVSHCSHRRNTYSGWGRRLANRIVWNSFCHRLRCSSWANHNCERHVRFRWLVVNQSHIIKINQCDEFTVPNHFASFSVFSWISISKSLIVYHSWIVMSIVSDRTIEMNTNLIGYFSCTE